MYESGIDCIRDSFTAAAEGIKQKIRVETEAWDTRSGDYEDEPQYAEDGSTLFDPADIYSYLQDGGAPRGLRRTPEGIRDSNLSLLGT